MCFEGGAAFRSETRPHLWQAKLLHPSPIFFHAALPLHFIVGERHWAAPVAAKGSLAATRYQRQRVRNVKPLEKHSR